MEFGAPALFGSKPGIRIAAYEESELKRRACHQNGGGPTKSYWRCGANPLAERSVGRAGQNAQTLARQAVPKTFVQNVWFVSGATVDTSAGTVQSAGRRRGWKVVLSAATWGARCWHSTQPTA